MINKNSFIIVSFTMIVAVLLFLTMPLFSQSQDNIYGDEGILFDEVRDSYIRNFPSDFTADIISDSMFSELEDVPEWEKLNPAEPFNIKFIFLKDYGERIIVDNACTLTRNKFNDYLEVYKSFRSFLDPRMKKASFFRKYKWEIVNNNRKYYVIKMFTRGVDKEYYQIYIEKYNMLVKRAFYYKDLKVIGRVDLGYKNIEGFFVPDLIEGYSNITNESNIVERKEFSIRLDNFKINQNLTVEDILGDGDIDC